MNYTLLPCRFRTFTGAWNETVVGDEVGGLLQQVRIRVPVVRQVCRGAVQRHD